MSDMIEIKPKDMVAGETYYIEGRLWGDEGSRVIPHRKKIGIFRFVYGSYGAVFDNVINIDDESKWDGGELFSMAGYKFYL